uniref:PH domain-containing protein n=1 Tax=Syphacia muris TaxID=451379 RepID=A0A0N5AQC8_9BILA
MLANGRDLAALCTDQSYERRFEGQLFILQDSRWRFSYAILKANLLFFFNKSDEVGVEAPFMVLIIEDCCMELCDDNQTGRDFCFEVRFKTTGRRFIFAAESFYALGKWISILTVSSIEYINLTKQSFLDQLSNEKTSEAYHSKYSDIQAEVGNMALCPLRTTFKGPAPKINDQDVIDEAILFFKPNIFFREYEIRGPADRTLIYLTLYITECLKKLSKCPSKVQAQKDMATLALSQNLPIPGEEAFPFNAIYKAPQNKNEEETMRAYLLQLRQELGQRLIEKVFDPETDKPNKWWICFAKRRFMDKSLAKPGTTL